MRSEFNPSGTGVALVTPFESRSIDFDALERIIDYVIDGGVNYIVSLGTTGEASTLSYEEQVEVLKATIKRTNRRVPIVAGNFGGNDTYALVQQIRKTDFEGISAILSSSPAYNKPTQEGIYRHYMELAAVCPVPVIIYNVPSRTCSNITAETCIRLAEGSGRFLAIKDASADMNQGNLIVKSRPDGFFVLSGDDATAVELIERGAEGVISVIANAYPSTFSQVISKARSGLLDDAYRENEVFDKLHPLIYKEGNPAGIKAALEFRGLCSREVRLPLVAYTENSKIELHEQMSNLALPC